VAVLQRLPAVGMQTRQDLVACFPANCRTVSLPALGMRMTTASTAPSGIDRAGRPRRESEDVDGQAKPSQTAKAHGTTARHGRSKY